MGNCLAYDKSKDYSINLAYETPSKPDDTEMPDFEAEKPKLDLLMLPLRHNNQEEPLVEIVEINHFKRPMLRRALTTLYTQPEVQAFSPKSNTQSRRFSKNDFIHPAHLKKTSFLFKAKEKLKKCRTSHLSYGVNDHRDDCNTEESTDGLHITSHPESTSKLDFYISSPKGDDEPELN
jgi:hypothetical protein